MSTICALLVIDVVDSTQLVQRLGDSAAAEMWSAHDRVARDLLTHWRGREIDKTDGFLLLFANVNDAAEYAMAYHRALAAMSTPLTARAGLHCGSVILRENTADDVALGAKPIEVEGLAKSMAARVMVLARGGQTLLTVDARTALGDTQLRVQSHGHWLMKGIAEPMELFEAGTDEAPFLPPPDGAKGYRVARRGALWLPVRHIDNNLPEQLTSFVGRRLELAEATSALSRARLLTLLGTGGIGKTRMSLQLATGALGDFPDGVWFVELASLADARQVPQTVASTMRVKEEVASSAIETLIRHVKGRRLLIVLDNCEHLLDACATLARRLLQSSADLKLLVTSREPLHMEGEVVYPLPTLAVPAARTTITAASLQQNDAARLFCERAQAARPGFQMDARNAATVADICRRLDGIPLALELAAARVRVLPVATIAERLNDRFRLLTGGYRTALPRQQTLRALLDWSHDLLTSPERALLRRLAVFAGGWTPHAAEDVGTGIEVSSVDVLDHLGQLVDKSLVVADADGQRYRLLETVRAYAQEKLNESGEADAARTRHLKFFLGLAERAAPELWGAEQAAWVSRLDLELENLLAAHAWCDGDRERAANGLRLLYKLQLYWFPSGQIQLGYRLTLEALARPEAQAHNAARCGTLYAASQIAYFMRRFEDVQEHGLESLSIAREVGNKALAADILLMLGYAADELKQRDVALSQFEESIALARDLGDKARLSYAINALAGYYSSNAPETALPLFEESLEQARAVGDRDSVSVTLQNFARSLITLGRAENTRAVLLEALDIAKDIGSRRAIIYVLDCCVGLASLREEWSLSVRLLGASNAEYERLDLVRMPGDEAFLAPLIARAREKLGESPFADALDSGRERSYENASAEARAWLESKT